MTTIQREEIPRERYLTEKEYRAFGLQGERRNLTPPSHIAPTLETYQRDYEREHLLRQPDHMYRDAISAQRETIPQRESIRADPLYLNEKEYQAYGLVARQELPSAVPVATALGSYTKDPYYAYHYGASSGDPYNSNLRRQEVPSGSYPFGGTYPNEIAHLRQTESDQVEGLYSTYAADAPPRITGHSTIRVPSLKLELCQFHLGTLLLVYHSHPGDCICIFHGQSMLLLCHQVLAINLVNRKLGLQRVALGSRQ
ncbi:hypothetical protein SLA2020_379610 [Shorea laevis]